MTRKLQDPQPTIAKPVLSVTGAGTFVRLVVVVMILRVARTDKEEAIVMPLGQN